MSFKLLKQNEIEAERPGHSAPVCIQICVAIYFSHPLCHLALDVNPNNFQSIKSWPPAK